jgi:protease II
MASKSDYTEPAKWLAALRELSPTSYQHLLAEWRIQHKQRRNLWKALEKIGLS